MHPKLPEFADILWGTGVLYQVKLLGSKGLTFSTSVIFRFPGKSLANPGIDMGVVCCHGRDRTGNGATAAIGESAAWFHYYER